MLIDSVIFEIEAPMRLTCPGAAALRGAKFRTYCASNRDWKLALESRLTLTLRPCVSVAPKLHRLPVKQLPVAPQLLVAGVRYLKSMIFEARGIDGCCGGTGAGAAVALPCVKTATLPSLLTNTFQYRPSPCRPGVPFTT